MRFEGDEGRRGEVGECGGEVKGALLWLSGEIRSQLPPLLNGSSGEKGPEW